MTSARRLYRLNLLLAVLAGSVVVTALALAVTRIKPGLPSASELVAACQQIVPVEPGLGLLIVVALLVTAIVACLRGGRSLVRELGLQRRFLRGLAPVGEAEIGGAPVTVVDSARAQAFCAGLLRPRLYVSTAAIELLSPRELHAVIAHEAHHRDCRDPLRILAARVLADAFFFAPALRRLGERYRQLAELAADEAAAASAGASALASALLCFGERRGEASAVVGIAPERVAQLMGTPPRWQLPLRVFSGSLVVLATLFVLVLAAPALAAGESLSLAALLAEACMVTMVVGPPALALGLIWISRSWLVRLARG